MNHEPQSTHRCADKDFLTSIADPEKNLVSLKVISTSLYILMFMFGGGNCHCDDRSAPLMRSGTRGSTYFILILCWD